MASHCHTCWEPTASGQRERSKLFSHCHWDQRAQAELQANPDCVGCACTYMGGKQTLLPAGSLGLSGLPALLGYFELMAGSLSCGEKHTKSQFSGALSSSDARGEGSPQLAAQPCSARRGAWPPSHR